MRWSLFALLAAALAGCAGMGAIQEVTPEEIPRLEELRQDQPENGEVLVRLGAAYRAAGRTDDATVVLSDATRLDEPPVSAWAVLGTMAEDRGDYAAAIVAYERYLESGGPAAEDVRNRLALVRRERLVTAARRALAREEQLSAAAPEPATVAVMTLVVDGPPEYEPLGRGLAEMLTTDLSITQRLQVLERARLQALIDEMSLGLAGYTDPNTAARAGRLLRAATIVQGRVAVPDDPEAEETSLEALVVDAVDPEEPRSTDQAGALQSLMDMEARLALALHRELGIQLTAAEESRILERPTDNFQAFLAFSRGLSSLDAGDFSNAASQFRRATSLDPGFQAAADAATAAESMARAPSVSAMTTRALSGVGPEPPQPQEPATFAGVEVMVDQTLPAGAGAATQTAAPPGTPPTSNPPAENTETTAGTGVKVVRTVPIILVRPSPLLIPWRWR